MKSKNIYSLPFAKDVVFLAGSDSRAHSGILKHAVDFMVDFNVPILACLDGEIWNVKDDATEGGSDLKYADWKYQNLITIKHANDEFSQYIHLAHKSVLVKIGDRVKKGQKIAKGIGMVGCTTAPHLHFMILKITGKGNDDWETIEIRFDEKVRIIRKIKEHNEELSKLKFKGLKEFGEKWNGERIK